MGLWKDGNWAVALGVAIFAAIGVLLWFTYYYDLQTLCAKDESTGPCVREWFGAFSGWIAAAAAAVAIAPLLGQLREQQRQTSFQLGDAEPTVDVENTATMSLNIRIVNWNRRTLKLRPLKPTSPKRNVAIRGMTRKTEAHGPASVSSSYGFSIKGWEDRSKPPEYVELAIELDIVPWNPPDFTIPVNVEFYGELIGEGGGVFRKKIATRGYGLIDG